MLGRARNETPGRAGARQAFKLGCDLGSGVACFWLVAFRRVGSGDSSAADLLAQSIASMEKSCDIGSEPAACLTIGNAYDYGRGVAVDAKRAFQFYKRACDLGVASACSEECVILADGRGEGTREQGAELCQRTCDERGPVACNNLGVIYERGQGFKQDLEKSTAAYRQACEAGSVAGCGNFCWALAKGRGVRADPVAGLSLCEANCKAGGAHGCRSAALLTAVRAPGDLKKAVGLLERSCDLGGALGCGDLAYWLRISLGGEADFARAREKAKWSCDRGYAFGCRVLADILKNGEGVSVDSVGAERFYLLGCQGGDAKSCTEAAALEDHGVTVPGAPSAAELRARGCKAGDPRACPP
jgi:TPR repeat protein